MQERQRRVLIFSLTYTPFIGGAEVAIQEITKRIDPAHIHFDLVTLHADARLPKIEQIGNVTVHRIGLSKRGLSIAQMGKFPWYLIKVLYIPLAARYAHKLAKHERYDAYWAMMTNMGFVPVLMRLWFKDVTPYILTLQDGDTKEHITKRKRIKVVMPLFKKIFSQATTVQAISHFLADFAKEMGYPGEPVVVPNGVNFALFADPMWRKGQNKLVYRFDKKPNDYFIITTSRLATKNAIDDVIRALALLPERFKFLILGEGPLAKELWQLSKDLDVEKRVLFLGHVAYEDIPAYLSVADVFVRPSLSEGMGNSFIEAMAARVPVVATRVGGIPDFLNDPDTPEGKEFPTGIFCKVRDPQSIATAINRIIDDGKLRERIIDNGQDLARHCYDWNLIARDMEHKVFDPVFDIYK